MQIIGSRLQSYYWDDQGVFGRRFSECIARYLVLIRAGIEPLVLFEMLVPSGARNCEARYSGPAIDEREKVPCSTLGNQHHQLQRTEVITIYEAYYGTMYPRR